MFAIAILRMRITAVTVSGISLRQLQLMSGTTQALVLSALPDFQE
jgi:hypothetical protein